MREDDTYASLEARVRAMAGTVSGPDGAPREWLEMCVISLIDMFMFIFRVMAIFLFYSCYISY